MVFNIVPTIIDIFVGVGYFVVLYNAWYGTLVFATMAVYVGATVLVTEWRTKLRREMNKLDNQKSSKAVDALLNFETVKYFNAEQYEAKLFKEAFIDYQRAEWRTTASLNLLNTIQNAVIITGLLIGTLLCSRDVVLGRLTVGDFVLFYTYLLQLYAPLGFFGTYYRMLQTSMTDMENMFELMELKAQVIDVPNAQTLQVHGGEVEFRNVCFCYSEE
ncbi:unnamed protein product [Dicrocoelium dendriticum]|nr:unnamed protein product [Dicrocoelium dendriticum]